MRLTRKDVDYSLGVEPYLTKAINFGDNLESTEDIYRLRVEIIRDLEDVFKRAMEDNQFASALKAKELMIRELRQVIEVQESRVFRITDLSDDELFEFIKLNKK